MTKEKALKKIKELEEYVKKCEEKEKEKEKEIPEMPHSGYYNVHVLIPDKPHNQHFSRDRSFENQESADLHSILSFELANLIYVRNYLGVKSMDTTNLSKTVWYVWFCPSDKMYHWTRYRASFLLSDMMIALDGWFFENEDNAQRVCDYMNKYVKDVKRNMY